MPVRLAAAALVFAAGLSTLSIVLRTPAADAQPEVTAMFPEGGDVFAEPPSIFRLCFASPVNIRDLDDGGDFGFTVIAPAERHLGHRIVFQPNGLGVDVFPGVPKDNLDGEWTFEWRLTDPDTLEPTTGGVKFTVGPGGDEMADELPFTCTRGGPRAPREAIESTPAAGGPVEVGDDGGDGNPDILLIALITIAAVGGAVVLGLVLFFVRLRIGFSPHSPPSDDEGGEEESQR